MNMRLSTLIRKSSLNIQGVPVSLEILIVNFEIDDHSVKLGLLYQNRLISDANLLHSWLVECPIARVFEFVEQLHRLSFVQGPIHTRAFSIEDTSFFFPTQFCPAASTIVLLETLIYKKQDLLKTASVKHDDNGWFLKGSVSWEDKWKRRRRILNVLWSTVAYAFTSVGCKVDRQKFFKF